MGPNAGANAGNIYTVVGGASAASTGDGGPAASALLNKPRGVAITPAGDLAILIPAMLREIRTVTPTGNFPATGVGFPALPKLYMHR